MCSAIDKIYITAECDGPSDADGSQGRTDVIVVMHNGERLHASFFSFDSIAAIREECMKNGAFLKGTYFWAKRMILVKDCTRKTIEKAVLDMFEEGELGEAFLKL